MTACHILLSIALAGCALNSAQAQEQIALTYRFVPGKSIQEHTRVNGEFRVGTAEPVTIKIEAATIVSRHTESVSATGEAIVTVRLYSTVSRMADGNRDVFSYQDRDGITTLIDGRPISAPRRAPIKDMTAHIAANGQVTAVAIDNADRVHRAMSASQDLIFPSQGVPVGGRWRYEIRPSLLLTDMGPAVQLPDIMIFEAELRSLQREQGRQIATIVATAQAPGQGNRAMTTYRFDVQAGEMLSSEGEVSMDAALTDPTGASALANKPRAYAEMRFKSTFTALGGAGTTAPAAGPAAASAPAVVTLALTPPPAAAVARPSLEQGSATADAVLLDHAVSAHGRGDYATAVRIIRPLAEQGNGIAQENLGVIYEHGQGVAQNYAEAAIWHGRAAAQGRSRSQSALGILYQFGRGLPQDYAEAAKWYRLAADKGYAPAQTNLGFLYDNGQGVPQSHTAAVNLYRLAAAQGQAEAQSALGNSYYNGKGVPQNYAEALNLYRLAAAQGVAAAQFGLGIMYENGRGTSANYSEAAKWYRHAADQGHAAAQFNLGAMYESGRGVRQSRAEAAKWYRLAADQGYVRRNQHVTSESR